MSQLIDSINELRAVLNGNTYSQSITFTDTIIPRQKVEDLGSDITGTLYPSANERQRENRGGVYSLYTIVLAITKKVDQTSDTDVDAMMTLVEEVAQSLDAIATTSFRGTSMKIDPIFDFNRLNETGVFTSMVLIEGRGR